METQEQINELALEFNGIVKKLIRKLTAGNKDASIDRLAKGVRRVTDLTPLLLLEDGSPYLWEYRKNLMRVYNEKTGKYNWDVVIEADYSHHWEGEDDSAYIKKMVDLITDAFTNFPEDDKIEVYDDVIDLLGAIARYRKLCKANGILLTEI